MTPLKTQAIQTALMGDFEQAITLNLAILKEDPKDIESLNRLAYAFTLCGKIKDAKETYKKVLELDEKNPIALKSLKRLNQTSSVSLKEAKEANATPPPQRTHIFLEESGKTKVIELVNIAEPKILSLLRSGEELSLGVKRLKIFAHDSRKHYIGMLPEDLGKRLIKFFEGGNVYEAYVKAIENRKVIIFVKETKRANKFKNQPSFLSTTAKKGSSSAYYPFPKAESEE